MKRATSFNLFFVGGNLPLLLLLSNVTYGHHSRSEYINGPFTEVKGEILAVSWANPHIEVSLRVTADDGDVEEWYLESQAAVTMKKYGVTPDLLRRGMVITVAGNASKTRDNRMEFSNVLLPDGLEVVFLPIASPRWSDRSTGLSSSTVARASGPLPDDGRGIFRVWNWEPPAPDDDPLTLLWMLRPADEFPLTEAARALAADWDEDSPDDSLALKCIAPGMPATMGNPHPIEFKQAGGLIEIRSQEFDVLRTIHMDSVADPEEIDRSPLGYSVGRWEGETLIVETSRLNAPYFTRQGVPQSESARIVERFSVDAEQGRLTDTLTFTDPEYLTEPFETNIHWIWDAEATVERYDCQVTGKLRKVPWWPRLVGGMIGLAILVGFLAWGFRGWKIHAKES